MLGFVIGFFLIALFLIYKSSVDEVGKKEENKQDSISLDPSAKDWEYQCELLDIIDTDEDELF